MNDAERAEILGTSATETVTEQPNDQPTQTVVTETVVQEQVTESVVTEQVAKEPVVTEAPKSAELGTQDNAAAKEVAPEPTPAPQVEPISQKAQVKAVEAPQPEFNAIGLRVLVILNEYAVQMAPRRPVTDAKVIEQQKLLYEALQKTINDSGDDFFKLMKTVLAFFEEHKNGVFHETRVFRGFDNITLSSEDRVAFQRLLNLFKLVANPQSRKLALKQVDLVASLQYGLTEHGRNRMMSFFHK